MAEVEILSLNGGKYFRMYVCQRSLASIEFFVDSSHRSVVQKTLRTLSGMERGGDIEERAYRCLRKVSYVIIVLFSTIYRVPLYSPFIPTLHSYSMIALLAYYVLLVVQTRKDCIQTWKNR